MTYSTFVRYSLFVFLLVVGAFKATGIQTATANKARCSGHGGGALGAQMNLFDRLARVIKVSCRKVLLHLVLLYVSLLRCHTNIMI